MAKRKSSPGKIAMFNEAKNLESKGKKQVAKVPPDEAPQDPKVGKGMQMLKGHAAEKMESGKHKGKPMMGKKTEMPTMKHKKSK